VLIILRVNDIIIKVMIQVKEKLSQKDNLTKKIIIIIKISYLKSKQFKKLSIKKNKWLNQKLKIIQNLKKNNLSDMK